MPQRAPKHDAVWVRQLAAELDRRGQAADRVLRKVGLDRHALSGDDARISFSKHAAFFEHAAEVVGDGALGFRFAQTRDARDAGLIGYVGLASPTVEDALKNLARYRRVFSDAVEIDVERLGECGRLQWWFGGVAPQRARQCIEFATTNIIRAIRDMCRHRVAPISVSFMHARNREIATFEAFFGCSVDFGADANILMMHPADLRRPIATSDDRLLNILRQYCQVVLARHSERPPPLLLRVERLIAERLTNGGITMASVAAELGMSRRTLSRKLAQQNVSFNAIVDGLRKELALVYLRDHSLSLTEIAFLLGYGELSTFNHAFKRWTGRTPSSERIGKAD